MGRFNLATAPIRDALKAVEGVMLPSVNVLAWIAQNVKSYAVVEDGDGVGGEKKRFQVVLGGEGDEGERLERERLVEAQRWVISFACFLFYHWILRGRVVQADRKD